MTIKMPILPSRPGPTVDGRQVEQKHIQAVLNYDPSTRVAIVKLDTKNAHDSASNTPVLGRISKTYVQGDYIYADVQPTAGKEAELFSLCNESGSFPFRSVEIDLLTIDGKKQLWLEAVSLCGSQKPALDLPSAIAAAINQPERIRFTVDPSSGNTYRLTKSQLDELRISTIKMVGEKLGLNLKSGTGYEQALVQSRNFAPDLFLNKAPGADGRYTFTMRDSDVPLSLAKRTIPAAAFNSQFKKTREEKYEEVKLAIRKQFPYINERELARKTQAAFAKQINQ